MKEKDIIEIVESHLFSYMCVEKEIQSIKDKYNIDEKDINSWIKSKGKVSRATETLAIKNIQLENEIECKIKWHFIIENILRKYEDRNEQSKLKYIDYKYFNKFSLTKIELQMAISRPALSRIKYDVIYYIALYAVKEKLIELEDLKK